jgi:phenylpyruvate tautomerase PptA (4-oxalocrotonate tautomerase family)
MKVILSRAARSARLTTHFDLDFPKKPVTEPYQCYKHGRICEPTREAYKFLYRYSLDTINRIRAFDQIRSDVTVTVEYGDARDAELPSADLVVTSPPYIGLIDYHEQHRYAFELLGLATWEEAEIGAAKNGRSKSAKEDYIEGITAVFCNVTRKMPRGSRLVIVANDTEGFYPIIREKVGVKQTTELKRHVNRRTGRRSTDFYESIFIWEVVD